MDNIKKLEFVLSYFWTFYLGGKLLLISPAWETWDWVSLGITIYFVIFFTYRAFKK